MASPGRRTGARPQRAWSTASALNVSSFRARLDSSCSVNAAATVTTACALRERAHAPALRSVAPRAERGSATRAVACGCSGLRARAGANAPGGLASACIAGAAARRRLGAAPALRVLDGRRVTISGADDGCVYRASGGDSVGREAARVRGTPFVPPPLRRARSARITIIVRQTLGSPPAPPPGAVMEPPVAPEKLTVPLLRAQLQARGLPTNGLKAELVSRLQTALDAEACSADMAVDAAPAAPAAAAPAAVAEPEPMDAAAQASAPAPVVAPAADAAAAAVAEPPSTVARAAAAQPVAAPAPQPVRGAVTGHALALKPPRLRKPSAHVVAALPAPAAASVACGLGAARAQQRGGVTRHGVAALSLALCNPNAPRFAGAGRRTSCASFGACSQAGRRTARSSCERGSQEGASARRRRVDRARGAHAISRTPSSLQTDAAF